MVYCGFLKNESNLPKPESINTTNRNFHDNELLAKRSYCGFQPPDDRLISGTSTAIDQFPWIVHALFTDDIVITKNSVFYRCTAVLISNRYVVSAGLCATFSFVQLGQNIYNQSNPCIANSKGCNILTVPVQEKITSDESDFGLGLLRLANTVTFSDYIRPICLPLDDSEVSDRSELYFSGWWASDPHQITKKRLTYKSTNITVCTNRGFKDTNHKLVVPVCFEPSENNDDAACVGDIAGPLMYWAKRKQWFADSIIYKVLFIDSDFNSKTCSNKLPIVAMKINMDVVEWILNLSNVMVCCATLGNNSEPDSMNNENLEKTKRNFHDNELLSKRSYCGFQPPDDRLISGTSTAIDQFPWIVYVMFTDLYGPSNQIYLRCTGVLINARYVLSDGFCALISHSVILGQYIYNESNPCFTNKNVEECRDSILRVPIQERISSERSDFSFGLLRLANIVTFTDYIRPICLPLDDSEVSDRSELYFSGWWASDPRQLTKKRLTYKSANITVCTNRGFSEANHKLIVPLCLEPKEDDGDLACVGQISGPLMYTAKRKQWFADSIIFKVFYHNDFDACKNKLPIGAMKINMDVVEWILNNIRP
ncbi:hypothetical protein FQR65_LT02163 [Abscondita terminalis]|nr:hypothetical protein FQR65_LT02163 [Abscondita terminalis]